MRRTLLVLLALITISAVACGDDNGDDKSSSGSKPSADSASSETPVSLEGEVSNHGTKTVSGDSIDVEVDDFYFGPTFIEAPAGKTVTVKLENEGEAAHTFTIDSLGIDVELQPGTDQDVQVKMPDSGPLRFYCRFHQGGGMQGAFTVS